MTYTSPLKTNTYCRRLGLLSDSDVAIKAYNSSSSCIALQYMAQIKEKQDEQEAGDWDRLSATQRQETENEFHHLSMLARFHNIMGVETIQCLEMLTKEIKSIFCHPMIVDRMAAMLNYFLLHLVSAAI